MNKPLKIILITIGIILLLIFSYILGFWSFLNAPVNQVLYGSVDKSCNVDSDCVLKQTTCEVSCACREPVNKDWKHKCFFAFKHPFSTCSLCGTPGYDFEVKCVNNQCERITIFREFDKDLNRLVRIS